MDANKEFNQLWGRSTGCTLRLAKPWFGTWRTLIGDSWFASVNTALACVSKSLHFVGNVKTGYKDFPKAFLTEKVFERDQKHFMRREFAVKPRFAPLPPPGGWPKYTLFAASHCDKKPCHLVATRGTSNPGCSKTRWFRMFRDGEIVATRYLLDQPHFHELYRNNFNAVDVYNKQACGPTSLINVLGTKSWWKRVWVTLLCMAETNAYLAYCHMHGKISRAKFREELSRQLLTSESA